MAVDKQNGCPFYNFSSTGTIKMAQRVSRPEYSNLFTVQPDFRVLFFYSIVFYCHFIFYFSILILVLCLLNLFLSFCSLFSILFFPNTVDRSQRTATSNSKIIFYITYIKDVVTLNFFRSQLSNFIFLLLLFFTKEKHKMVIVQSLIYFLQAIKVFYISLSLLSCFLVSLSPLTSVLFIWFFCSCRILNFCTFN